MGGNSALVEGDPAANVFGASSVRMYEMTAIEQRVTDTMPDTLDAEANQRVAMLKTRLIVCSTFGVAVVVMSAVGLAQFKNWEWIALALSLPIVTWGAWPFYRAALMNLRFGAVTVDTLFSLGVVASTLWSIWAVVWGDAIVGRDNGELESSSIHIYFGVATVLTVFILTGRYLEARAERRMGAAIRSLLALGARYATIIREGAEVVVDAALIEVGDLIVVRAGEIIAADGIVEEGCSSVDASMLTGENMPVDVVVGTEVTGTTVNLTGRLVVRVRRIGAESTFAQITKLVRDAQSTKAPVQKLADRVSSVFVPAVITFSVLTFVGWFAFGDNAERMTDALTAAVAVLIIACPCAIGLATPTALMVGTGRAARMGIVIKGVDVLQSTRRIDTVVFDKTGTVTSGVMELITVVFQPDSSRADVLKFAGSLEHASDHPIAKVIASAARAELGTLLPVGYFESWAGLGTIGVVDGRRVMVGSEALFSSASVTIPTELEEALNMARIAGNAAVLVAVNGRVSGVCVVADKPKPSSAVAIAELRQLGLRPVLLTGDNRATALAVAEQVGIETDDQHVISGVLPAEKVRIVADLQERGYAVAMVGDGVNDAAALAQADVGIAMGTLTDVAMNASDLTIVSGDLRLVSVAILLSRATLRTISTNVILAFVFNTLAIPIAVLGHMNPTWVWSIIGVSSVFVAGNSLRLRSAKLTPRTAFVHATR